MPAAGRLQRTAAFPHRHQLAPSTASAVGDPERSPELALNRQSAATSATQPRPIVTPSTANNRKTDHNRHLEIPSPNDNDGKCPSKFLCATIAVQSLHVVEDVLQEADVEVSRRTDPRGSSLLVRPIAARGVWLEFLEAP